MPDPNLPNLPAPPRKLPYDWRKTAKKILLPLLAAFILGVIGEIQGRPEMWASFAIPVLQAINDALKPHYAAS